MFKRLICSGASRFQFSKTRIADHSTSRAGRASFLALAAGAALALPAAWPLIQPYVGSPLQAQLAPMLPDLVATEDGSPEAASLLPLPDGEDAGAARSVAAQSDEPRFEDDAEPTSTVAASESPRFVDVPRFSDDPLQSDEPVFEDDAPSAGRRVQRPEIVRAYLTSQDEQAPTQMVSVLSAEDVKNLITRARLEIAAGDLELAHRFAEAAAEVPIPVDYFKSRPQLVLDEIEHATQVRNAGFEKKAAPVTEAELVPLPDEPAPTVAAAPLVESAPSTLAVTKDTDPFDKDLLDGLPAFEPEAPVSEPKAEPALDAEVKSEVESEPKTEVAAESVPARPAIEPIVTTSDSSVPIPPTFAQVDPPKNADAVVSPEPAAAPAAPLKPLRPTERLQKTPRAYQALSQRSLNVQPRSRDPQATPPRTPESQARKQMAQTPVVRHDTGMGRNWGMMAYLWEAPAYYRSPLYFEEVQLERYGNEVPFVQPVVSGAHFVGSLATLPYQMATEGNGVCAEVYDLHCDRPGDCVPYSWQRLPWSYTGAAAQTGTILGLVFVIP